MSDGNRAKRDSRWGTLAVLLFPTDELVGGSPNQRSSDDAKTPSRLPRRLLVTTVQVW
ncbi:MAG: hypothetical protein IJ735_03610 [Clostridia bacterium]|nr:hypothetical protein [Clostridia bacterium]